SGLPPEGSIAFRIVQFGALALAPCGGVDNMALTGELLIQQAAVQADYAHICNIRRLQVTPRHVILHFIAQIMQADRFSIYPQPEVTPEVSSKQAIYLSTVSRFDQVNLPVCAALQCYFQIIVKN